MVASVKGFMQLEYRYPARTLAKPSMTFTLISCMHDCFVNVKDTDR